MTTRNQNREEPLSSRSRQHSNEPASGTRRDATIRVPSREGSADQPIRRLLEDRTIRYDNDLYERQGW